MPIIQFGQRQSRGLFFRRTLDIDPVIAIRLIGRQQTDELAPALRQKFHMETTRPGVTETSLHGTPVKGIAPGLRWGDTQLFRGRQGYKRGPLFLGLRPLRHGRLVYFSASHARRRISSDLDRLRPPDLLGISLRAGILAGR